MEDSQRRILALGTPHDSNTIGTHLELTNIVASRSVTIATSAEAKQQTAYHFSTAITWTGVALRMRTRRMDHRQCHAIPNYAQNKCRHQHRVISPSHSNAHDQRALQHYEKHTLQSSVADTKHPTRHPRRHPRSLPTDQEPDINRATPSLAVEVTPRCSTSASANR